MQVDMSFLRSLMPSINQAGSYVFEEEKVARIKELNEENTIRLAVESIKAGAKGLYFTTGHINQYAPFKYQIKDRVVQQLQLQDYIIEQQEMRSDTSSVYGHGYESWLEGVCLSIKSEGSSISKR